VKQNLFRRRNEATWRELEQALRPDAPPELRARFPRIYRRTCQHLAVARTRLYSARLIEHLDQLVLAGHQRLYGSGPAHRGRLGTFFGTDFPRAVRQEWRLVLVSALVFFLPLLGMLVAPQVDPDVVYTVLDADTLVEMEGMYEPGEDRVGRSRDSDSDVLMFAFYVYNNTGIGFRTFAGGLLFGIGTLFILFYNGLVIGTVAGHLTRIGYGEPFWSFVAGHSALELTAVVLSGAAGLRLGLALLAPGRRRRREALRLGAATAVRIVGGAAAMFLAAAFVEGFWSSMTFPPPGLKYATGILFWVLVLGYLLLQGRGRGA
jgi:uncharacterized membrane protein SpoIIM required for sporulation